ncbi:hypothetical protein Cgig2_022327 [Carnegiea gigantea]|uniref:Cation/H+ exchanger transmembrane domain-containing protein n=1 Tax=Carnegiea gigantea TaxID=171969 RepID=A0A9Q1GNH9_9CARY|nr:hypothetical protein Cgig2_022327 [Carnegiea gigantea]
MQTVFPPWSTPTLESVASIGLLFFLFLVGLELDLGSIWRSGRRAFSSALPGITIPFMGGAGVAVILRRAVPGADHAAYGPFVVFMGVSLSITAFPVLARILAELKLLTTHVGETAMAAAAFNDVAAWILLALAVALAGNADEAGGHSKSPLITLWVLLCGIGFVGGILVDGQGPVVSGCRRASVVLFLPNVRFFLAPTHRPLPLAQRVEFGRLLAVDSNGSDRLVSQELLVLDDDNSGDCSCSRLLPGGNSARRYLALVFNCSILVLALVFDCSISVLGSMAVVFDCIVVLRHFGILTTSGCRRRRL